MSSLPTLNACLNATCTVFLLAGYFFIRRGKPQAHRLSMSLAMITSILFLISYLIYHAQVGSKPFQGTGWIRPVYFTILISHTILATAIVPLVIVTVVAALRGRFEKHRALARWTWPLWMYVSVTGVVIYLLLYGRG